MAGLAYTYIPLEGATLIHRKHPRDIAPPGMTDIKNMIISRSDKSLTLRPDFDVTPEYVLAIGSRLKNGDVTEDEFLNSVVGLYGTGELIWITSSVPVVSDAREIKCSILISSGTTVTVTSSLLSVDGGDTGYLCTLSSSSVINASEDVWSGCYIKFSSQSFLYRISSIASETEFYIDESPGSQTDSDFEIYRPHNIINSDRKANIQTFGSNIIYGIPCGVYNSTIDRVSGPFYTVTADATSTPGGYLYDIESYDTGINSGVEDNLRPVLFTKDSPVTIDSRYFGVTPPTVPLDETPGIMTATATEILDELEWTSITDDLLATPAGTIQFGDMTSDGTDIYLSGQISDYETEDFSEGFEAVDGYSLSDPITATTAWSEADYNQSDYAASLIVASDSERAIELYLDGEFGIYSHYAAYSWDDAETTIVPDGYGWSWPLTDIYTKFQVNMGISGAGTPQALDQYNKHDIFWGFCTSANYIWGYGIEIQAWTDSGSESTQNHFRILYSNGGGSGSRYLGTIDRDDIYPEDGEIYWARLKSWINDDGDTEYGLKVWQGDEGDEPSEWMTSGVGNSISSGPLNPCIRSYYYNVNDEQIIPSLVVHELNIEYSTRYETDRTTFVHKFDESAAPSFSDVSPASSFTEYRDSGDFRSNFVYDTANSSLVLGFIDLQNYMNFNDDGDFFTANWIRYSTDGGANWSTPASMAGYFLRGLFYSAIDSKLYAPCIVFDSSDGLVDDWNIVIRMSDDGGATWTDYADLNSKLGATAPPGIQCGFFEDDTNWCILFPSEGSGSSAYYIFGGEFTATAFSGTRSSSVTITRFLNSSGTDGTNYDAVVFVNDGYQFATTADVLDSAIIDTTSGTVTWSSTIVGSAEPGSSWSQIYPVQVDSWANRQYVGLSPQAGPSTPNNVYYSVINVEDSPGAYADAEISVFYPISDVYRSNVFSVLDGYLVLFGTAEYDSSDDSWSYTTRRIRWTAPNAVTDFTGVGSGVGEVPGNGIFLDARAVNGRIVTFETSSIGALVPRGIVADPWDYDVIYEGIKILSNPCVVEDKCYFIASDGLLHVTNGISVEEAGSSFDMSLYDDFTEESPIWLIYSSKLKSLLVFYPESSDNVVYMINLATGSVSYMTIPLSDESTSSVPFSVVSIENSSDQRVFISYDLFSGTGISISKDGYSELVIGELSPGDGITGIDSLYESGDDHYWDAGFETGNIFVVEEGVKVALKHVIIHTYTDAADGTTDMPDIIVEVKSLEDSAWNGPRDQEINGSVTVTDSACTINSSDPPSALTNLLGTANGTAITYNLPWIAANCRVFTRSGSTYTPCALVTTTPDAANEYQITGTQQIKVYGTNFHFVYCFCENEPFIKVEAGDYIESDEGLHRITSLTNYTTAALDRYKVSGSDATSTHYSAEQMAAGHGQVKLGINRLVEGVQLKIRIVPRRAAGETDQPSVAKITGISLGYIPLGEKIVEATGG